MTEDSGFDRAPGRGAIFDVLDAASALLGAPLIFEDAELNVIAWSAGQAGADPERLASIIDRRPEPWLVEVLRKRGVLDSLARGGGPQFLPPASAVAQPRMGCGVLVGGRPAGYVWAATVEPFDADRSGQFQALAHTLAELVSRPPSAALTVDDLAQCSPALEAAATRCGLRERTLSLIAVHGPGAASGSALGLILRSLHPAVLMAGTWAVVPSDGPSPGARRSAETLAAQQGGLVAVADPVAGPEQLPAAVAQIRLVQAIQSRFGRPRVAEFADVQLPYALLHLRRAMQADGAALRSIVDVLRAHDAETRSELVATLRAHLGFFGDANAAARSLHLHTNTFRYRMRRITELTGFDPRDGEQRFLAELHLRLSDLDGPSGTV